MAKPLAKTLFDKIWDNHVVCQENAALSLIYIDLHLIHELSSPQAFEGLKSSNQTVRRPDATLAVPDHNVATTDRTKPVEDPESALQLKLLEENTRAHGIEYFSMHDPRQGIVHVIGPEQGLTQPGMSIVCGDSHTSTHGALGAWAFGIGTSEVEHVLATQTLVLKKPKNMRITVEGELSNGITAKDLALHIIGGAQGAIQILQEVGERHAQDDAHRDSQHDVQSFAGTDRPPWEFGSVHDENVGEIHSGTDVEFSNFLQQDAVDLASTIHFALQKSEFDVSFRL